MELTVGGLTSRAEGSPQQHLDWITRALKTGDVVTVRVVEAGAAEYSNRVNACTGRRGLPKTLRGIIIGKSRKQRRRITNRWTGVRMETRPSETRTYILERRQGKLPSAPPNSRICRVSSRGTLNDGHP